jgi:glycosyltransferase involved in cell wall biosynthesis
VENIKQAGGIVHCFSAKNNIQIILKYWDLAKYIRDHQIELVHCHLPWAGFVGRLLHRFARIPVIYTEHNKQERYHGITFFLNKLTFNWQNKVIAVSEDVQDSINKNIRPRISVQTILNGVNTESFVRDETSGKVLRQQYNIPVGALVIGTIAVFRFQKRLVEWLEVAKAISDRNHSVYFVIVGDGPLKQEILAKRSELKLERNVIMAGLQTNVKPWLSAIDVYMMTSVFEGLPIALLEAMSMSCTIVTTDAGGIKEVIRNGEDGLIVTVDEYNKLPELIQGLQDHETRVRLSINARKRVVESFSLKKMVLELENVYHAIAV